MSHELCHVCQLGDPFRINTDQVVGVLRAENEAYLLQGHKMAFLSETNNSNIWTYSNGRYTVNVAPGENLDRFLERYSYYYRLVTNENVSSGSFMLKMSTSYLNSFIK